MSRGRRAKSPLCVNIGLECRSGCIFLFKCVFYVYFVTSGRLEALEKCGGVVGQNFRGMLSDGMAVLLYKKYAA